MSTTTDGRALLTPAELAVMLGVAAQGRYMPEHRIGRALARWGFIAADPVAGGRWAQTPTGRLAVREALDSGVGPDRGILYFFDLGGEALPPPETPASAPVDPPLPPGFVPADGRTVPRPAPLAAAPESLAFQCLDHPGEVVVIRARQVVGHLWDVPTAPFCGHPDHGLDPFGWPEMRRVRIVDGQRR
jgi:hypothetical protein